MKQKKRGDREAGSRLLYLDFIKAVGGGEDLFSITSGSNEKRMRERVYQSRSTPSVYRPSASMKVASYIVSSWLVEMAMNHHSFQFRADDGWSYIDCVPHRGGESRHTHKYISRERINNNSSSDFFLFFVCGPFSVPTRLETRGRKSLRPLLPAAQNCPPELLYV